MLNTLHTLYVYVSMEFEYMYIEGIEGTEYIYIEGIEGIEYIIHS